VRYLDAFIAARDELLAEAQGLSPEDKALDDEALCTRPPAVQAQVQAWRWRDVLARIEFAPIISGSNNDDPAWKRGPTAAQDQRIKRFADLFTRTRSRPPLAFLIVKSMLLTGFDAPIEGVMHRIGRSAKLNSCRPLPAEPYRPRRPARKKLRGCRTPEGGAERLRRRGHRRCAAEP
jgi:hypothetical protein